MRHNIGLPEREIMELLLSVPRQNQIIRSILWMSFSSRKDASRLPRDRNMTAMAGKGRKDKDGSDRIGQERQKIRQGTYKEWMNMVW